MGAAPGEWESVWWALHLVSGRVWWVRQRVRACAHSPPPLPPTAPPPFPTPPTLSTHPQCVCRGTREGLAPAEAADYMQTMYFIVAQASGWCVWGGWVQIMYFIVPQASGVCVWVGVGVCLCM